MSQDKDKLLHFFFSKRNFLGFQNRLHLETPLFASQKFTLYATLRKEKNKNIVFMQV